VVSETAIQQAATSVFRTDLARPGFAHLDLGVLALPSEAFSEMVREWAGQLAAEYRRRFGRSLAVVPQGSFDQQVTTAAHRDGGPDESVLVLGYEPTAVASRLLLLDFSRAAFDRGLSPAEFLAVHNPVFPAGRQQLEGYVTEVSGFDPAHAHVVIINNSNRPLEERHAGMLGVLHQAIIVNPDPSARRMIHSLILTPLAE
jgi:hypothetical protein